MRKSVAPYAERFPQIANQVRCSSGFTVGVASPFGAKIAPLPPRPPMRREPARPAAARGKQS